MEYPFLFVALDYRTLDEVVEAARQLASVDGNFGFKVNMNIWFNWAPNIVMERIKNQFGKPIFADVKMFLGKITMSWLSEDLVELGVDFANIHLTAGTEAVQAVNEVMKDSDTNLLGLTVPTHYNDKECQEQFGRPLMNTVMRLVSVAGETNCDGIILPPSTLQPVGWTDTYGKMLRVVPGIRAKGLPGFNDKRHAEPFTIEKAIVGGADILVIGTPITKSPNPAQSLKKVLSLMDR